MLAIYVHACVHSYVYIPSSIMHVVNNALARVGPLLSYPMHMHDVCLFFYFSLVEGIPLAIFIIFTRYVKEVLRHIQS